MNKTMNENKTPVASATRGSDTSADVTKTKAHVNGFLCRTSAYKPPGSNKVGLAAANQPAKIVWELDYSLNEKQFGDLSKRFPGIAFVQTGFDCHDHPISHTSYRVVWENVVKKLKPGSLVADVAGNPQYNEAFNKRQVRRKSPITIDTFCKVMTPKDSIRMKTRWGPAEVDGRKRWEEMTVYDMYRNDENRVRFARYDTFLFNHTIYYYTFAEITQLLNLNKNAVAIATIHKLEGQNGTINCGEQQYEKDFVTGKVTQKNVETGEEYVHADPAPWFQKFCYADEHGAMAWTINKGCDDTYVITMTSTDPRLVPEDCWLGGRIIFSNATERIEVTVADVVDPPPAYAVEEVCLRTHDLLPGYHKNVEKRIKITHPELYSCLKAFMVNKPRNHRTLGDLTAKAHREVGNNTLMGHNRRIKISPEALTEHIFAAWMAGADCEAEMFEALVTGGAAANRVNRNLAGKTLSVGQGNVAKQALRIATTVSSVMRSKEPVHQVLTHIDDLL